MHSDQPDMVACTFTDVNEKTHIFHDKWTAFTDIRIDVHTVFPVWAVVASNVVGRRKIKYAKTNKDIKAVTITTETPWNVSTIKGLTKFEVFEDMVME